MRVVPKLKPIAKQQHEAGTTRIGVLVDAGGRVTATWIIQSSGFPGLDEAAFKAARASTYRPPKHICQPAHGFYEFVSTFTGI